MAQYLKTGLARRAAALACVAGLAVSALAQEPRPANSPIPQREMAINVDSGLVRAQPGPADVGQVVFAVDVHAPQSGWLRLAFDQVLLAGDPAGGNASYLRITSYLDGHHQILNAESVAQWSNSTAYFNGDVVRLELIAFPGAGDNRVTMSRMTASEQVFLPEDICGGVDDRVASNDPRNARLVSVGCTAWMWDDLNSQFGTAGHCGPTSGTVQFNVPLSLPSGTIQNPPPEDQYAVESISGQGANGGIGNDWGYFAVSPNSNTGQQPFQRQGQRYTLSPTSPTSIGSPAMTIRITGFGTTNPRNELNQAQKTHTGPLNVIGSSFLRYVVDTTGGNSGSPVLVDAGGGVFNQRVVGVHTHAGCSSGGNQGTRSDLGVWNTARNNPRGIAASGRGTPGGNVYAIGDGANNFGTCNTSTGNFAKIAQVGVRWQGLAFDANAAVFYGVNGNRELFRITGAGVATLIGTLSTTALVNGLAYDPFAGTLYGISLATGQLFAINTTTAAANPVGAPGGGNVAALEFDPSRRTLFGIDDAVGGSRLVSINTTTGAQTVIGNLGAGITDCNGLAFDQASGQLFTINNIANTASATDQLFRVNPATGAATLVGQTGGSFGVAFGMTGVYPRPTCPGDWNGDGVIDFNDLLEYLNDYNAQNPRADLNADGIVDFNDLLEYLNLYNTSCP
jgi:hypothetical protein